MVGARQAQWRERWARQENGRRQQAYQASLAAWQQQQAEHQRCLDVTTAFRPEGGTERFPWLQLKRGEAVYWAADGVGMVETPYAAGLRPPGYRELYPTKPGTGPPVDVGQAAVTNQRIILVGRARREWAYAKLTGLAHTHTGATLMLVSNRKKVSGVVPPLNGVVDFRLRLALALADAAGERDGLVEHLSEQASRHLQARPAEPAPASPDQAPISAWFSGGRLLGVVAAASVLLLALCTIGALAGTDEPDPGSLSGADRASTTPSPSPSPAAPRRPPRTQATVDSSPTAEPAGPDPTTGQPARALGDCAAYLDSDGWCVDGLSDYDCEGGTGNGPGYAPSGVELVDPGVDPFGLDRDGDGVGCDRPSGPAPAPPPPPPPDPEPDPDPGTDPRFDTCAAAKAAGYGPYQRGQDPEYDWYRDADGDGVVCE
jgi:hypothetical protein